jgi:Ca-activated chloride channel family protein
MNRSRLVFIGIIAIALIIVAAGVGFRLIQRLSEEETTPQPGETPVATVPAGAVVIEVHSSDTKQDWMNQAAESFNAEGHTVDGKPISVKVVHVGSGTSMNDILDGKVQPVGWSPGSDPWVATINQTWRDRTGQPLIKEACPATLHVPLAIAMWQPMAQALGWPDAAIGWEELAALSTDPQGWGAYGHPEWGQFKFGHPHPEHSNSGLLSLIAEVYSAVGRTDGLTVEDAKSQAVKESVGAVEEQVYHYGKKDTDLLLRMTQRGPEYLHAVTSYESNVIKWNRDHGDELAFPLVAIYPDNGTFWAGNPYCILDAEWVSDEQAEAAAMFRAYILSPEQQAKAMDFGLRPADPSVALRSPIDLEHGAVPATTMAKVPDLAYPSDEVVGHIIDTWHEVKKKATVVLLLDTSGSMKGDKIKGAIRGSEAFLDQMNPADEVYVVTFSSRVSELQTGGAVGEVGEGLKQTLNGLYAEGSTVLYEAVIDALDRIDEIKAADEAAGEKRLYGIVLLSDGKNETVGGPSLNDMFSRLPSGSEAEGVKVYTIAYGGDADLQVLQTLANRTNGKQFSGDVADIEAVYFLISSEF